MSLLEKFKLPVQSLLGAKSRQLSDAEILLLTQTKLFSTLSQLEFEKIIAAATIIRYPKAKLIFPQGAEQNGLYIITQGSVRIFQNLNNSKIPVARLYKGDYFGAANIIGEAIRTRFGNIETILDTTIIQIDGETIRSLLGKTASASKESGYAEATKRLIESIRFYSDVKCIIDQDNPASKVLQIPADTTIFEGGARADNVYFILRGSVKLVFPPRGSNKSSSVILPQGHLFGELGVINNKPRAATAIANEELRLLAIDGEYFKKSLSNNPQLNYFLSQLQTTYQLPIVGVIEQYVGATPELGNAITSVYKLNFGQEILSTRYLDQNLFIMFIPAIEGTDFYAYQSATEKAEIAITDKRMISVKTSGAWRSLPKACKMILDAEPVNDAILSQFKRTGCLPFAETVSEDGLLCECMMVTKNTVQDLIHQGVKNFDALSKQTGACTVCAGCTYRVQEMLGQSLSLTCRMKKIAEHNNHINSYQITPIYGRFAAFAPGQHVTIQVQVDGHWVERPYVISDIRQDSLFITIEKKPYGFFSSWLFNKAPEEVLVLASQPQGKFHINLEENHAALCIARDIGIAPFITFVKALVATGTHKKTHILYCVEKKADFSFTDLFNTVVQVLPTISIQYWSTEEDGPITRNAIVQATTTYNPADIYICGSEGFEHFVFQALQSINYKREKIHIEHFYPVGS